MPLTGFDLYKEIERIEKVIEEEEQDVLMKCLLKAQVLTLKMLHSIRTNIVRIMKAKGIPLLETKRKKEILKQKEESNENEEKK